MSYDLCNGWCCLLKPESTVNFYQLLMISVPLQPQEHPCFEDPPPDTYLLSYHSNFTSRYYYSTYVSSCLFFDNEHLTWSSQGCSVSWMLQVQQFHKNHKVQVMWLRYKLWIWVKVLGCVPPKKITETEVMKVEKCGRNLSWCECDVNFCAYCPITFQICSEQYQWMLIIQEYLLPPLKAHSSLMQLTWLHIF